MSTPDDRKPATHYEWERALVGADLPNGPFRVAIAMLTFSNRYGGDIRPGFDGIAERMNGKYKPRTVRAYVAYLRDHGWVDVVHAGSNTGATNEVNEYQLTIPLPGAAASQYDGGTASTSGKKTGGQRQKNPEPATYRYDTYPKTQETMSNTRSARVGNENAESADGDDDTDHTGPPWITNLADFDAVDDIARVVASKASITRVDPDVLDTISGMVEHHFDGHPVTVGEIINVATRKQQRNKSGTA